MPGRRNAMFQMTRLTGVISAEGVEPFAVQQNGLIRTAKSGRVRTCELNRERFALVESWLEEQRRIWTDRTDRLEQFVTNPEEQE